MPKKTPPTCYLLRLESFEGADTLLHCGNAKQDFLYCIVTHSKKGELEIIDNGYRTKKEALAAWPEIYNSSTELQNTPKEKRVPRHPR